MFKNDLRQSMHAGNHTNPHILEIIMNGKDIMRIENKTCNKSFSRFKTTVRYTP